MDRNRLRRFVSLLLLWGLMWASAACNPATPEASSAPTATLAPAPADSPVPTFTAPPSLEGEQEEAATPARSSTPAPTPSATAAGLTGPRATALALLDSVTLVPRDTPTPWFTGEMGPYLAIFEEAWRIVQENYVRGDFNGVDWEAIGEAYRPQVEAAANQEAFWDLMAAFIGELHDDHSRFVRPGDLQTEFGIPQPDTQDSQGWIGMTVWPAREDEQLLIWDVCLVGPAAGAGLSRGDVILEINGQSVPGELGLDREAIYPLLYAEFDSVTLLVQRGPENDPEKIVLVPGAAAGCDGWYYGLMSDDPRIGYVRVPEFSGNADVNLLEAIALMEEEASLDGLVVDVRHNPGGNSDRSIAVFTSGVFGLVGPLREGATQTTYRIRGPVRWNETTPVAVLIDGSSHSAAEYFATAMQQSGRAVLVGMPTAGNTEGITGFSLPDGSLIRLAVSTLELPDGSTLEETGVLPDIQVPLGEWGLREIPDLQLSAAYKALVKD